MSALIAAYLVAAGLSTLVVLLALWVRREMYRIFPGAGESE